MNIRLETAEPGDSMTKVSPDRINRTAVMPVLCVGVFCQKGCEVLLIKRSKPPRSGAWSLPGGRVEFGERCEDAAARELHEEVGLTAVGLQRIGFHEFIEDKYHLVVVIYRCNTVGTLRQGGDAADVRWWHHNDIPKIPHTEGLIADAYSAFVSSLRSDPKP